MATFVQEFMAEMRRQASFATSMPPLSPVVSTPTALAPISPAPISSALVVPSWKVGSWITEVERGFCLLKIYDDLKVLTQCTPRRGVNWSWRIFTSLQPPNKN
ncbi:hypothetical protein SLEP1_g28696 [Rubroshorea leprosula]|uniref:Uncharacterized protein n=1 Tax=Rubroshorea leprosula TaxID=152421 RepID=A0AAV5JUG1_9ROSI|nr:hypothetical protein SLEP1_g28696 [Rubroshorea leprosula]